MTSTPTSPPDTPLAETLEQPHESESKFVPVRTSIPASRPSRIIHRSLLRFLDVLTRKAQKIERHVRGIENLQQVNGPFIIACNHVSLLDSPMLHISLPRRYASHTAVVGGLDFFAPRRGRSFTHVLWRRTVIWFIRSSVNVALIDRSGGDYSNFEMIENLLSRGWSLVIFPEATRSRSGKPGRMRLGVAELARRHGCPVLPGHIEGTNEILPIGGVIPQKGVMRISIGAPLTIDDSESTRMFVDRLARSIGQLGEEQWSE